MATILQFPPPERYAHRRNVSSIPHYHVEARVEEHPLAPRRLLSQLWVAVLTLALIFLAIDLASADPLKYGSTNAAPARPSTPFSVAAPGTATLPASATTSTADDIRDIRGPVHIAPSWMWLAYLVGGLALAAALYALYRWWKSRAKERAKTSFEIALEALANARSLMAPDKVREYSFRVSEITRNYIEARFGTRAAHRTTEEFLHDLVEKPSTKLAEHAPLLEDFLKHCDLAKFARWTLSPEEMEKMHHSAVAFVTATNPALEVNPSAPTAPELRSSEA